MSYPTLLCSTFQFLLKWHKASSFIKKNFLKRMHLGTTMPGIAWDRNTFDWNYVEAIDGRGTRVEAGLVLQLRCCWGCQNYDGIRRARHGFVWTALLGSFLQCGQRSSEFADIRRLEGAGVRCPTNCQFDSFSIRHWHTRSSTKGSVDSSELHELE